MDLLKFHHNKKDLEYIETLERVIEQLKSQCSTCKTKLEYSTEVTVEKVRKRLNKKKLR